ncbi:hypothetical protein LT493_09050 [Streptomyces tricolor]|nr:hypothetical protein [Streptomyces tricolor]
MTSAARAARTGRPALLAVDGRTEGDRVLLTARGELVHGATGHPHRGRWRPCRRASPGSTWTCRG